VNDKESVFGCTDVHGLVGPNYASHAATSNTSGSICYYCKKQGHFAYMCPKKLKTKIRNLVPKEYQKTWDDIVKRRRIPYGFVSVLPVDFVLLTYIKRYNQTRALYNLKVDKEIESIMQYEDQNFIQEYKNEWVKKKKTRENVAEAEEKERHQMMQKIAQKVEEKNLIDISKKINNVIEAKNTAQIPLHEAQKCVQQIADDKKEHDKALSKLLENFFPKSQQIQAAEKRERKQNNDDEKAFKEALNNNKADDDIIECINRPDVRFSKGYYVEDGIVMNKKGEVYDTVMPKEEKKEYKPKRYQKQDSFLEKGKQGKYLHNNEYVKKKKLEEKQNRQKEMMWNQYNIQQNIIDERHRQRDMYMQKKSQYSFNDDFEWQ